MEVRELRIGNYVEIKDWLDRKKWHQLPVVSILKEGINPMSWGLGHEPAANPWKDVRGIPITKELLLRLGFHDNGRYGCKLGIFCALISEDGSFHSLELEFDNGINGYEYYTEVKFVHQLQNLYYALTGEELIWKP